MSNEIILNQPLPVVTAAINTVFLSQLNDAWMHNAMLLGYFCLAVGFLIGAVSMYFYMRRKYEE